MSVKRQRKTFDFVASGSRFVFRADHLGKPVEIHVVLDVTRQRQARPWQAIRKVATGWSGMGESRFKTAENAARAALEYWGF